MPGNAYLEIRHVSKTFGQNACATQALRDVSFTLDKGRFLSILGPSGCGKSTLFNIMAGLISPSEGNVLLEGRSIVGRPGHMGYMLQRDLLLPWRTIEDNVTLAATLRGGKKRDALKKAHALMDKCGLQEAAKKRPDELSGGMRQRAALIRTLLTEKDVLLLDEPFGALDAITRARLQWILMDLWAETGKTILFVTHDIEEAILLSDEVLVLSHRPGQVAERLQIPFERPRKPDLIFSPDFVGIRQHLNALLNQEVNDDAPNA